MKILEIVKHNEHYAFIVDEAPALIYREEFVPDTVFGPQRMLIGRSEDGRMDFLTYHNYGTMRAFAGRPLSLTMTDGATRVVKDVWWSEGAHRWEAANGVEVCSFAYATLDNLLDCYVFYGSCIRADCLQAMIAEFYSQHQDYVVWEEAAMRDHISKIRSYTEKLIDNK